MPRCRFLIAYGKVHLRCGEQVTLCKNHWLSLVEETDEIPAYISQTCKKCFAAKPGRKLARLEEKDFMHIRESFPPKWKVKLNQLVKRYRQWKWGPYPICKQKVWNIIKDFDQNKILDAASTEAIKSMLWIGQECKPILLIGSGPVEDTTRVESLIATGKYVVACCNRYDLKSIWKPHWPPCDIHFLSVEATREKKTMTLPGYKIILDYIPSTKVVPSLFSSWSRELALALRQTRECTRGYYAFCICCALSPSVAITGFGGKGHANNARDRIAHGVSHEHAFMDALVTQQQFEWIR